MIFILPTNTCFWIWCFTDDLNSYQNIYKIKNRDISNPLSVFVENYEFFENNTSLSRENIEYLKNYNKAFTVIIDINKIHDENLLKDIERLSNSKFYKKIGFRVAHTFMHRRLIHRNWPFFLSSANRSWETEIKSTKLIKSTFAEDIKEFNISVFAHDYYEIPGKRMHSNIIEFTDDWLNFFRL